MGGAFDLICFFFVLFVLVGYKSVTNVKNNEKQTIYILYIEINNNNTLTNIKETKTLKKNETKIEKCYFFCFVSITLSGVNLLSLEQKNQNSNPRFKNKNKNIYIFSFHSISLNQMFIP